VVMRGSDHVAPLRDPERFSRIVREFAQSIFDRGTTTQGRTA